MSIQGYFKLLLQILYPRQKATAVITVVLYAYWVITSFNHDLMLSLVTGIGLLVLANAHLYAIANQYDKSLTLRGLLEAGLSTSLKGFLLCTLVMGVCAGSMACLGALITFLCSPMASLQWLPILNVLPFMMCALGVMTGCFFCLSINANVATNNNSWRFAFYHTGEFFKHHRGIYFAGFFVFLVLWVMPDALHWPSWISPFTQGFLFLMLNGALLHAQRMTKGLIYA